MTARESFSPLTLQIVQGVHAGALDAISTARATNTKLVIWHHNKIVEVSPDDIDAIIKEREEQRP